MNDSKPQTEERQDAEENIYYRLATITGDHLDIKTNRRYWMGWLNYALDEERKARCTRLFGVNWAKHKLSAEEISFLQRHLKKHLKDQFKPTKEEPLPVLNDPLISINFFNLRFPEVDFSGFLFPGRAFFRDAHFETSAKFEDAQFEDVAVFYRAQFEGSAYFQGAQFEGKAIFSEATFKNTTRFNNSEEQLIRFQRDVPQFYNTNFHPDLEFTIEKENWPNLEEIKKGNKNNDEKARSDITSAKNAYTELRRQMNALHKVEEEQFFYRQEMSCQRELEKSRFIQFAYASFDQLSDYGWSIIKPLKRLFISIFLGMLAYTIYFRLYFSEYFDQLGGSWYSLALSASSSVPLFGTKRQLIAHFEKITGTQSMLIYGISMVQALIGTALIFLLLLALRNRFRLR